MITKFEVINFKNFKEGLIFDFTSANTYDFNAECIKVLNEGKNSFINTKLSIVNKGIIYGENAVGKSNLGLAMFDIVANKKLLIQDCYKDYLNVSSNDSIAEFKYTFNFDGVLVEYLYGKSSLTNIVYEELRFDSNTIFYFDRVNSLKISIKEIAVIDAKLIPLSSSFIQYLKANIVISNSFKIGRILNYFLDYIDGMLLLKVSNPNSPLGNEGFCNILYENSIQSKEIRDLEEFLKSAGISIDFNRLKKSKGDLLDKYKEFFEGLSTSTRSLCLFYNWLYRLQQKNSKSSFIYIDDFDIYYSNAVSEFIVKKLINIPPQVILTTNKTATMTNDLLRPDCFFIMDSKNIKAVNKCTVKELRFCHNLERIYRAGGFSL